MRKTWVIGGAGVAVAIGVATAMMVGRADANAPAKAGCRSYLNLRIPQASGPE